MSELKACPFCGGRAKSGDTFQCSWVQCTECGVSIDDTNHSDDDDSNENATALWNRRTPDPLARELAGAIADVLACGTPIKVSLYDEEGVEGWQWDNRDKQNRRIWDKIGSWDEAPPPHPLLRTALAKAEKAGLL